MCANSWNARRGRGSASKNPGAKRCDFVTRQGRASFGRHEVLVTGRKCDSLQHDTVIGIPRRYHSSVLASLHQKFKEVEAKPGLLLACSVAGNALSIQDR